MSPDQLKKLAPLCHPVKRETKHHSHMFFSTSPQCHVFTWSFSGPVLYMITLGLVLCRLLASINVKGGCPKCAIESAQMNIL